MACNLSGNLHEGWGFHKSFSLSANVDIPYVPLNLCGPLLRDWLWTVSSVVSFQCEHNGSLHLRSRCISTFENVFCLREIISFKNIYFFNAFFDADRIGFQSASLVPPRAVAHFWNNLLDITLWWLTAFSRFTQPFVMGI